VLGIATLAAAIALSWLLFADRDRIPEEALEIAPRGSTLVGRVEVERLLGSGFYRELSRSRGGDRSLKRIERLCGFNPLERIREGVVFVSGDRRGGEDIELAHVGFVARGDLQNERVVGCVRKVVRADGGQVREVDIEGHRALASVRGDSRAAFVGGDGVVGGDEATVRRVLRILGREETSATSDATLTRLWREIAPEREIAVVARVPEGWRRAIRRAIGDRESEALALVGHAQAIGIGVRIGSDAGIGAIVQMDGPPDARGLVDWVRARSRALLDEPMVALSVAGPVLRRIQCEANGRDAVLALDIRADQILDLMELYRQVIAARGADSPQADRSDVPRAPQVPPSEIIERQRGAPVRSPRSP